MTMVPKIIISTFQSMAKNTSLSGRIPVATKITAVVSATIARLFGSVIIRMYISTNKMIASVFNFFFSSDFLC